MQPVPSPRHLDENTLQLAVGREYAFADLRRWLAQHGFKTAQLVAMCGQYASRGGIIDLYPPAAANPYRLEFFGDELESIRTFDVATQRSIDQRDEIAISACGPVAKPQEADIDEVKQDQPSCAAHPDKQVVGATHG